VIFFRYTKALDSIKSLRKDRIAELKAEKERLESLQREKQHADKLKTKISDLSATISRKEIEYESLVNAHDEQLTSNKHFYDNGHRFRESYQHLQNLQEKITRYRADLSDAQEVLQEFNGSCLLLSFLRVV
jgi:DNA repair protein RAD50